MAYKAIIHYPANQEQIKEIHKSVAQYRAEKTAKFLTDMGVTTDTLKNILHQKKIHNSTTRVC